MADLLHSLLPADIPGFETLAELALNLRWSWNHSADELWGQLDPEVWALTHNPWVVLQTVSRTKLKALAAEPHFQEKLAALVRTHRQHLEGPAWFQQAHA